MVDVIVEIRHGKKDIILKPFYVTKCCYNAHFQMKRINFSRSKDEGLVKRVYKSRRVWSVGLVLATYKTRIPHISMYSSIYRCGYTHHSKRHFPRQRSRF